MCCVATVLLFLGPRAGILVWWLVDTGRFDRAFDTFFWPFLGFIFLPWTTLTYLLVFPGGVNGFDWVWLAIGLFLDISSYGGGYRERGYVSR